MSGPIGYGQLPPAEIHEAALKVTTWAAVQGLKGPWAIAGLCSRDYAEARRQPLPAGELERLLRIAAQLEEEARTWTDGFAVKTPGGWHWEKQDEWAQIRWTHLTKGAEFLRQLVARHVKRREQHDEAAARAPHPDTERLNKVLNDPDYHGGVQYWMKKHDEVQLALANLVAEIAARAEAERR